ncbi:MAG: type IX secretion system sortase PorU, partial [Bacteroidales bacterium]
MIEKFLFYFRYFLFISLILIGYIVISQPVLLQKNLQWNISENNLFFQNCSFTNSGIPFFEYSIHNSSKLNLSLQLRITNKKEILVSNVKLYDSLPVLPELKQNTYKASDIYITTVSFIPIVYESGKVYIIESFEIITKAAPDATYRLKRTKNGSIYNSVLSSGEWVKVRVKNSGVYKITYEGLRMLGYENISSIRVFGNYSGLLPTMNNEPRKQDLIELPIEVYNYGDGMFGKGDYVIFYAQSPHTWKWNKNYEMFLHEYNIYSPYSYYFVLVNGGTPKLIENQDYNTLSFSTEISSYNAYDFQEKNDTNLLQSGQEWYELIAPLKKEFVLNSNISYSLSILSALVGSSSDKALIQLSVNNSPINTYTFGAKNESKLGHKGFFKETIPFSGDKVTIGYTVTNQGYETRGYLDYVVINYRAPLIYNNKQLHFTDKNTAETNAMARYTITGNVPAIWQVTDACNPKKVAINNNGGITYFNYPTNELHNFIAFDPTTVELVELFGKVKNQNLHGLQGIDMVIVCNDVNHEFAKKLADLHSRTSNLAVQIVNQEQIFNEFSGGRPDVTAIRDFMKYLYDQGEINGRRLRFLLFFGDGSYNNNDIYAQKYSLLTYQSKIGLDHYSSWVSDDYFALLDDDEGVKEGKIIGAMDIAVGRLPVNNQEEARIVTEKIINYAENKEMRGSWRNSIAFLADDADKGQIFHMEQSDNLTKQVALLNPNFNFTKIFLDAYKQISTSGGARYPDVNKAIEETIKKGCLVFNYTGHGNPVQFTGENVLNKAEVLDWDNKLKLPLFITASCEVGRYDDYTRKSLSEAILLKNNGGGIAMITTTRVVYAGANYNLNSAVYNYLVQPDEKGNPPFMGEILRKAKNDVGIDYNQNKFNFILLGDPALRLALPVYKAVIDTINHKSTKSKTDTIHSLSLVSVKGHVQNQYGIPDKSYTGTLYVTVFDKERFITTLSNDGASAYVFKSRDNALFRGKASVINGTFSFDFITPKDIYLHYDF